ncbi:hypothetical protein D3C87_2191890 [compost metagenome]
MGVDDAERRFLGRQVQEDARQDGVLQHIGEVSGMEAVSVIHGAVLRAFAAEVSAARRR